MDVLGVLDTLRRRALEMEREAGSEEAWTRVAQLFCELGSKFYAARSWEDASDCYDRALQAKAFFPRALRLKLELLDRQHELEQSEKLIQATERAVGDLLAYDPQCHYQKCLQLFRCGRLQEAEKELRRLVEAHRGYAGMYLLAQVLDQKGEYQEGFSWAERAGEVLLTTSSYAADSFRFHEGLQKKTRRYKTLNSSPFRNTAPGRVPHFLVGYPRSGTTLLQHMLETHPQIQTLEEQGTLDFCERFVFEPDSLISLTDTELDDAASLYWQKVETHIDGPGALILDKMPLNIVYLDAVFHLFPK